MACVPGAESGRELGDKQELTKVTAARPRELAEHWEDMAFTLSRRGAAEESEQVSTP